jgi:hypothetical protein
MLTMVRDCLPREIGNGWKLPTFHNLMHIVSDMRLVKRTTKFLLSRLVDIAKSNTKLLPSKLPVV